MLTTKSSWLPGVGREDCVVEGCEDFEAPAPLAAAESSGAVSHAATRAKAAIMPKNLNRIDVSLTGVVARD